MPKILENIRELLLQEAKRQVFENGYSSLTIRSVAGACGIGVGTVYNYFESKDALVAGSYHSKRELLRNQIAAPLLKFCESQKKVSAQYLAEFTAESMLVWTLSGGTYEDVSSVLLQLFS